MRLIILCYQIFKKSGIIALLKTIFTKITYDHYFKKRYINYPLTFTTLKLSSVLNFVYQQIPNSQDLILVPEIYKKKLKNCFKGTVISTADKISEKELINFERLIWATERIDKGALIARSFFKEKKKILVMQNTGPARVWMHDYLKESVLKEEFKEQSEEGIDKFGYGIGADFGNLLQFIDNTKNVDGDFVEIGCYFGSSTCVMARYLAENNIQKKIFVYDTFNGFEYKSAYESSDISWTGTHSTDGKTAVENRIKSRLKNLSNNLEIHKRNILDPDALKEVKEISFANIDVDLYEATYSAILKVHQKLNINGIIVLEDAGHTPWLLGAKVALEEFLEGEGKNKYHVIHMESGQYILIKLKI